MVFEATPKNCAAALPVDVALIDESKIGLVHQSGSLQGVAGTLMPQVP